MRSLSVQNFSCIKSAVLEFNRLTILIGPQASGKSVLCKLAYFFIDILHHQPVFIAEGGSIDSYRDYISNKFREWFPYSAWGEGKFSIVFNAGNYKISLSRISYSKKVSENFRVKLSPEFATQYEDTRKIVAKQNEKKSSKPLRGYDYEAEWRIRDISDRAASRLLGRDYVDSQMFIPAGRSFFTSIGKAVAAFEQGRVLDPLIIQFGRIFATYKDRRNYYFNERNKDSHLAAEDAFAKILGGRLINSGDQEFVECADGRKVPLSALSSGQQELLPLAAVMPRLLMRGAKQVIYIEEPEAHLFPSAQSSLVEIFGSTIARPGSRTDLVLTTHSPYVLVKINNLIKAGQLGRSHSEAKRSKVQVIIPRSAWIGAKNVNAYAIRDGVLENIIDSDGLIDAAYLDDVSGDIAKEYMRLLEIEDVQ
ncbi:AAA family ATPase [Telluria beijingensis]|uniref:AAA family ATPase n=1 Tax=Telluria beijingensis TaxID=3068633 RepID=UPI0027953F23|nr:ATP-binding protein [Massilia sp. REN29]